DAIAELALPVDADCALDVAALVRGGVHVDLEQSHVRVSEMLGDPVGRYQCRGIGVRHHVLPRISDAPHATHGPAGWHPRNYSIEYLIRAQRAVVGLEAGVWLRGRIRQVPAH